MANNKKIVHTNQLNFRECPFAVRLVIAYISQGSAATQLR